jgi:hypothetical protein
MTDQPPAAEPQPTPPPSDGVPGASTVSAPPASGDIAPSQSKSGNVVGLIAFIISIVGFVFACLPGAFVVGWVLLPVAFILAIVGLVLPNRRRSFALTGLIVSVVGTIVGIIVFFAVVATSFSSALGDGHRTVGNADPSSSATSKPGGSSSFAKGVLTTPDVKIVITDHKVIPVGQPGNEYGQKPVIAFYYSTTNLTDKRVDPSTAFIGMITAYQDNDPNAENRLDVGALPDERFLDTQTEVIKKGGTVENAIAYELDDLTTPVELVASGDLGLSTIGKVTYPLG